MTIQRKRKPNTNGWLNALTLFLSFLIFFPILWMILTAFKTEADAIAFPPVILFAPTFSVEIPFQQAFEYDTQLFVGELLSNFPPSVPSSGLPPYQ